LPEDLRNAVDTSTLLIGPGSHPSAGETELPQIRQAIRSERKLEISYRDNKGDDSLRIIWPFALGYFDHVRVLAAWCELRQQFRHFRADRIISLRIVDQRYPRRRQILLKEWHAIEAIVVRT